MSYQRQISLWLKKVKIMVALRDNYYNKPAFAGFDFFRRIE